MIVVFWKSIIHGEKIFQETEEIDVPATSLKVSWENMRDASDPLTNSVMVTVRNDHAAARTTIDVTANASDIGPSLAALFHVVLSKAEEFR